MERQDVHCSAVACLFLHQRNNEDLGAVETKSFMPIIKRRPPPPHSALPTRPRPTRPRPTRPRPTRPRPLKRGLRNLVT
jgi:hypothetical protein